MSQVDQKRAFNKLKHNLEPWRNLIVHLDSLLLWEKNVYPAIICAGVSGFFLALWLVDLSIVTMLSLAALSIIAFDCVYPSVSRFLFSPDNWSGSEEMQYEHVCTQLLAIKTTLFGWYEFLFTVKERKTTMFAIVMSISLVALAWIGAVVNNLLLMYVVILAVALYPGIQEKQVLGTLKEKCSGLMNSKIQQIREKAKKTK